MNRMLAVLVGGSCTCLAQAELYWVEHDGSAGLLLGTLAVFIRAYVRCGRAV